MGITLYNTGQQQTGAAPCNTDSRWTVDGSPAKITTPAGGWLAGGASYKWIAHVCDAATHVEAALTTREFSLQVEIPRYVDLSTLSIGGQLAADDALSNILVNGGSTGIFQGFDPGNPDANYTEWFDFTLTAAHGFVHGSNTITFRVDNDASEFPFEPFGIMVRWGGASYQEIPQCTLDWRQSGTGNWTGTQSISDLFVRGVTRELWISFNPEAVSDRMIVRKTDALGPILWDSGCVSTGTTTVLTVTNDVSTLHVTIEADCEATTESSPWSFLVTCDDRIHPANYHKSNCCGQTRDPGKPHYRQARDYDTNVLVDVWLPADKIPGGVAAPYHFYDYATQGCYKIDFTDPTSTTPGNVLEEWMTAATADVQSQLCGGSPP